MNVKIVVTGPFASGKTEFIKSISEIGVVSTEKKVKKSDELEVKEETTVAMDFGRITIDDNLVLHLFGTPGQERFDFMWDILGKGALGTVMMVDSTRGESLQKARRMIDFFHTKVGAPYVVVANKQDLPDAWSPNFIRAYLDLNDGIKVIPCVAKDKESVKNGLRELVELVMKNM